MMELDSDSETSLLGSKRVSDKKEKKSTKSSKPRAKPRAKPKTAKPKTAKPKTAKPKTAKKDSKVSKKVRKTKTPVVKKPPKWHCPDGEERMTFLNYLKGWI